MKERPSKPIARVNMSVVAPLLKANLNAFINLVENANRNGTSHTTLQDSISEFIPFNAYFYFSVIFQIQFLPHYLRLSRRRFWDSSTSQANKFPSMSHSFSALYAFFIVFVKSSVRVSSFILSPKPFRTASVSWMFPLSGSQCVSEHHEIRKTPLLLQYSI